MCACPIADRQFWLINDSKLPVGENVRLNGCLCLGVGSVMRRLAIQNVTLR